jgi:ABC-type glycerol-3-phosphate transport system substrate-binding protein
MIARRWLTVIACVLVFAVLLTACAPQPTTTPAQPTVAPANTVAPAATEPGSEPEQEPVAEPEPAVDEEVTIQLWSTAWFPSSIAGRMALVDTFNAEHKGKIQVEFIQGSWGDVVTYVQSGIAAGGGIACVVEWEVAGGAQDWYEKGWVMDLSPYVTPERRALMEEPQWEARTMDDGAIVGNGTVLWEPQMLVLYNPAHLAAAGVEPATVDEPWTWDELIENAKLMTLDANGNHLGEAGFDANQVEQWGFLLRLDHQKVVEYGLRFAQERMGAPVIREENGEWGWYLDENGMEVYERFLSVLEEGVTPDLAIGLSGSSLEQAFADGKASMIMRESFAIPIIQDTYPGFELAAMPTPFEEGERKFYEAGGEGMVLVSTCEHPEAAAEFLFWMMEPENLALYAHGNGMLPANYKALEYEPFASDPAWDNIRDYIARGEAFVTPYNPYLKEFKETVAAPVLMDVVEGKRDFAAAMQVVMEQASVMLNQ